MHELFTNPDRNFLLKLLDVVLKKTEKNAIGWPDIFACKDGKIKLFEVKVKDSLLDSQVRGLREIVPVLAA